MRMKLLVVQSHRHLMIVTRSSASTATDIHFICLHFANWALCVYLSGQIVFVFSEGDVINVEDADAVQIARDKLRYAHGLDSVLVAIM